MQLLPLAAEPTLLGTTLPLVLLGLVVALLAGLAILVARLGARAAALEERASALDKLEPLAGHVRKLAESEDALDLRRLEHVLVDIRDGQRRVEERLLGLVESLEHSRDVLHPQAPQSPPTPGGAAPLAERVVTRLLALGYERIELLTPLDDIESLADDDGELVVEARKDGSLHKGRVHVRSGAIVDVQLRSTYEAFP